MLITDKHLIIPIFQMLCKAMMLPIFLRHSLMSLEHFLDIIITTLRLHRAISRISFTLINRFFPIFLKNKKLLLYKIYKNILWIITYILSYVVSPLNILQAILIASFNFLLRDVFNLLVSRGSKYSIFAAATIELY